MFYSLPSRCPLNPFVRSLSCTLLSLTFVQDSIFFFSCEFNCRRWVRKDASLISKFTVSHLVLWFRLYVQIHYSQHSQWFAKLKYTQLTGWTWLVKQFHVCLRNSWWLIVEIIHSCSVLNEVTQGWTAHPNTQRMAWVLVTTPKPSCPSSAKSADQSFLIP